MTPTASIQGFSKPLFTALPPLSLYIHIPWCVKKCPYCDFNSHEAKHNLPEQSYVAALLKDLESALPQIWGRKVHTIFFGGGTPSLFSADAIDAILCGVRARLPLEAFAEITLEANPGTFEAEKFAAFRSLGINRLSIGLQSFNTDHLKSLGRIHDAAQAYNAIEIAQKNFENFNLDLMYALPKQTLEQALQDIKIAVAYKPAHLSAYHLTLEPNTLFHHQPPPLPDDELSADMQSAIETALEQNDYTHYETSAFALSHKQCRHNLNYWLFGDYLGIGAGAHSKLSFPDKILRQARYRHPETYMKKAADEQAIESEHLVLPVDLPFEFMMNALRLNAGFPILLFQERTGLPITVVNRALDQAEQRGLIERNHLRIRPTLRGQRFLNDLLQLFLAEHRSVSQPS